MKETLTVYLAGKGANVQLVLILKVLQFIANTKNYEHNVILQGFVATETFLVGIFVDQALNCRHFVLVLVLTTT